MKSAFLHQRLLGEWRGNYHLWLRWFPDPEFVSAASMTITRAAKGSFVSIAYAWIHEEIDQEGLLIFGNDNPREETSGAWIDSWHQSGHVMHCKGNIDETGVVTLLGYYEVPPDPDWSWRITIEQSMPDELCIRMHNISPDGAEELAVEADFVRIKPY